MAFTLTHLFNLARHALRKINEVRSPRWPKLEKEFLAKYPTCAACGSKKRLNVHHKMPFHLDPDMELEESNLITLCMDKDCHLLIGHGDDFRAYNPKVVEYAAACLAGTMTLSGAAGAAKLRRLYS
jgi:HNH endonuclease